MEQNYFKDIARPIIFQKKELKSIIIKLYFPFEKKEEEIAKKELLPALLVYMNEQYPSEEEFSKETLKNYILHLGCGIETFGTREFYFFILALPNPKLIKENFLENAFLFFLNTIYHPYIIENGFSPFELEREKKNLIKGIENSKKQLRGYLNNEIINLIDTEGILKQRIENHLDQIEEITPQNLYQFYQEKIQTQKPISFIIGDVEGLEIEQLFQKHLYHDKKTEITFPKQYNCFLPIVRTTPQEITEEKDFEQSSITLCYKIKDMKEEDKITLLGIQGLLASQSSDLLNQKLRQQKGLIYSSWVMVRKRFGTIEITTFIDSNKKQNAIDGIKEVIESLKDETEIEPLLQNLKERLRINLERKKDNKMQILNDYINSYFGILITSEEEYQLAKKVTAKEIKEFVNRLQLDTIYFVKEKSNEKAM